MMSLFMWCLELLYHQLINEKKQKQKNKKDKRCQSLPTLTELSGSAHVLPLRNQRYLPACAFFINLVQLSLSQIAVQSQKMLSILRLSYQNWDNFHSQGSVNLPI